MYRNTDISAVRVICTHLSTHSVALADLCAKESDIGSKALKPLTSEDPVFITEVQTA